MGDQFLKCSVYFMAGFDQLLKEGTFADCSLAAEGQTVKAHRAVLSAASAYFELLFSEDIQHERDPLVIFTNIRFNDLETVLKLIYRGEVEVTEDRLPEILNVLTFLKMNGVDCNELVRRTNVTTCGSANDLISVIPEASSICEKVEGEVCVQQIADNTHTVQHYLSWDGSSVTMVTTDGGSNTLPCEVKSELGDFANSLSVPTSDPAFGYEFSCLVSDIEIKEEEIDSNVKIEENDMTIRIEDANAMEDANDDNDKQVPPGQDDAKLQIEDTVQCESGEIDGEEPFSCPTCDFRKTQGASFTEHIRNHILAGPLELLNCNLSSVLSSAANNGEFENHKGQPFKSPLTAALEKGSTSTNYKEKPFKCVHCSFACTRKRYLIPHMRTHTGEKPFKCPQCTYACSLKGQLTRHMLTHTGEKPFQCSQCTYACIQKERLRIHMRTHSGEKPFKCPQCTYACSGKESLRIHMRTHSGEKPFQCSQCTFACHHKGSLRMHMRTHSGEKPFQCPQCTHACSRKGDLRMHMRTHSGEKPFKCPQCTYACSRKESLRIHMRTHSGEKPFQCSQCTFACRHKGSLRMHMRTHSGEKPFKCPQCTYACNRKHNMTRHVRTH